MTTKRPLPPGEKPKIESIPTALRAASGRVLEHIARVDRDVTRVTRARTGEFDHSPAYAA